MKENKLIILFSLGKVQCIRSAIGLMSPFFIIKPTDPWYVYPGTYSYHNRHTCFQKVNTAVDVIDIVLPVFSKELEEAFCS